MKLTTLLLIVSLVQVSASTFAQRISLSEKNVPITKVLTKIKSQTGYDFVFTGSMFKNSKPVSIEVQNAELNDVLKRIFDGQAFEYTIEDKSVVISRKTPSFLANVVDALIPPINVVGAVLDEKGGPLVGATIKVKDTQQSTTTDANGRFTLNDVDEKAILVISFIGYKQKEVDPKPSLSISLEVQSSELQEVVVAYGKTTQQAFTGAVTVLKGEQLQNQPNRSFDKSLQGLVPGLMVTLGTGVPGGGNSNFMLRGIGTNASSANFSTLRNPLIVIDGVPVTQETSQVFNYNNGVNSNYSTAINNPLAQINPSNIESISILKDAAATALYGATSSNGVILVTTKKGVAGKTSFTFRHQTDLSSLPKQPKRLNQHEYLELLYEAYKNSDPVKWTDAAILADLKTKFPVKADGSFYPAPDWISELYNNNAITISNEIGMSGGTEKSTYYLNLEWTKQNGILKNTGYDRKSMRYNFQNLAANWLRVGMNTELSYNIQDYGGSAYNPTIASAGSAVLDIAPLNPVRLENGDYYISFKEGGTSESIPNPLARATYNTNRNTAFRGISNLFSEVDFLRYFKFKTLFGIDFMLAESYEKNDPRLRDELLNNGGRIEEMDNRNTQLISTNTIRYNQTIRKHHRISMLIGQEAQSKNTRYLDINVTGIKNPYYDQITSPGAVVSSQKGYTIKETKLSYFGQANYDFRDKYFVSTTIRRDGSSKFGEDKRFGTFWSAGAGWLVSEENFMERTKSWLDYLKIRGSIGSQGNAGSIDRFTPYERVSAGTYLGNTSIYSTSPIAGNADVKWEKTVSWNAGVDLRLLNNRIALTADFYNRTTYDLIYSIPTPSYTGFSYLLGNLGTMLNKGVEISLSTSLIQNKSFQWRIDANWSSNKNALVKADTPLPTSDYITINQVGKDFNSFYLPVWAGVDAKTGLGTWIDTTGIANIDYNAAEKKIVGKAQPDGFGSLTSTFSYKGFQLETRFYYEYGKSVYSPIGVNDGRLPYANETREALNRWRSPGDIAINPKRILNNPDGNNYFSTRYLFNADYITLQNVTLRYSFKNELLSKMRLSRMSIYLQGNNLAIWTKGSDRNPGEANSYGTFFYSYPIQRTYSFGLTANF